MFVPLYDANKLKTIRFQIVTVLIIITNVLVYAFLQGGLGVELNHVFTASFAVIPTEFMGGHLPDDMAGVPQQLNVPEPLTVITYMFLHASWLHLGGNMLFLWVFGDNVEDALGHGRFLLFYLLCGIAAGLLQIYLSPQPHSVLVGASGAVAGVIAGYLLLYPHVWVWVLVLGRLPLNLKAYWVILAWIAFQVSMTFAMYGDSAARNVAWWAHIGGFLAGLALVPLMRRPGVRLLSKSLPEPGDSHA